MPELFVKEGDEIRPATDIEVLTRMARVALVERGDTVVLRCPSLSPAAMEELRKQVAESGKEFGIRFLVLGEETDVLAVIRGSEPDVCGCGHLWSAHVEGGCLGIDSAIACRCGKRHVEPVEPPPRPEHCDCGHPWDAHGAHGCRTAGGCVCRAAFR